MPVEVVIKPVSTPVLQIVQTDPNTLIGLGTSLSPLRAGPGTGIGEVSNLTAVGTFSPGTPLPGTVVSAGGTDLTFVAANLTAPPLLSQQTIGVVISAAPGSPTVVQYGGIAVLTTAQWDAITGTVGGLAPGPYYLSATPGHLTRAPTLAGAFFLIGIALDSTRLLLSGPRILRL